MAVELVRHSDSRIDRQQLAVFINSYQRVAPLTIGELWAWPSMLKLALIENLRRLAVETLESRRARLAADAYVSRIEREAGDTVATACRRPSTSPRSSSSCIGSASTACGCRRSARRSRSTSRRRKRPRKRRFAASTSARRRTRSRWPMRSPACASAPRSTGANMSSRSAWSSRCCSAIPPARTDGWTSSAAIGSARRSRSSRRRAERRRCRVALRAVESARQAVASGSPADRAAHVGYHLIDQGRRDLEADVAYRPPLAKRDAASGVRPHDARLSRPDRDHDGAPAGRGRRVPPVRRAPPRASWSSRCCCC